MGELRYRIGLAVYSCALFFSLESDQRLWHNRSSRGEMARARNFEELVRSVRAWFALPRVTNDISVPGVVFTMALRERDSVHQSLNPVSRIEAILFDFGGVLAEEGFREGLLAIARSNHLPEQEFFQKATDRVYETGYVVGKADEAAYWADIRDLTGIDGSDQTLRTEILSRFVPRPWMIELVKALKARGLIVAVLSDQTQWLDELDREHAFFRHFDRVFNSYHMGKGKKDPTVFGDVVAALGVRPSAALFIDDNPANVERARSQGLQAILYRDRDSFMAEMERFGLP